MALSPGIRELWTLDPEVVFLNHGSFGACPRSVLEAQRRLQAEMEAEPVDFLVWAWDGVDGALEPAAAMLGCPMEQTVFVDNATTGVNAVLRSRDLRPGDTVLTTTHAYGAVQKALRYVCDRTGAELVEVEVPFPCEGIDQVVETMGRALERADRPVLGVVDHLTSKTGLILPVTGISEVFRAAGVPLLIDGAHVPGHFPVDVPSLGGTWYTGNLHKWAFAPKGAAVLHIDPSEVDRTHPVVISHGYGMGLHREFHWLGTRDPTPWLAVPDAIRFHESLGGAAIWDHNRRLADEGANLLCEAWSVSRPAPAALCGAMVTLPVPLDLPGTEAAADDLHRRLRADGIEVPCFDFAGRVWTRISAQVYNELADYEALAVAMRRM